MMPAAHGSAHRDRGERDTCGDARGNDTAHVSDRLDRRDDGRGVVFDQLGEPREIGAEAVFDIGRHDNSLRSVLRARCTVERTVASRQPSNCAISASGISTK